MDTAAATTAGVGGPRRAPSTVPRWVARRVESQLAIHPDLGTDPARLDILAARTGVSQRLVRRYLDGGVPGGDRRGR